MILKVSEISRRDSVFFHDLLGENLAPFDFRRLARGPKIFSPRASKVSTMPRVRGASGPTTVRSIRSFSAKAASGSHPRRRGQAFGLLRNSGVSRRAEDFPDRGALGDLPDQGMLPSPAADDQDFHFFLQLIHHREHRGHRDSKFNHLFIKHK